MESSEDRLYMQRALQLATYGAGRVSPNPMVGAVIVANGRIIGEGWHRRFGEGHAEVNAVASVSEADRPLLSQATIYVTLEPCSHYGKTPPCAKLLIETGVKRVVVGSSDPNPLVSGRGVRMLREAGIDVTEGVLKEECDELNHRFLSSQRNRRPWIQLKWAQSADGYMAGLRKNEDGTETPVAESYSTPLTKVWMHRERAMADAILVGTNTVRIDNPALTTRLWPGRDAKRVTFRDTTIPTRSDFITLPQEMTLHEAMGWLFTEKGVSSLMVEGGAATLRRFIEEGLYDEIRREISSKTQATGLPASALPPDMKLARIERSDGNIIEEWRR